jgi:hypothetical protein
MNQPPDDFNPEELFDNEQLIGFCQALHQGVVSAVAACEPNADITPTINVVFFTKQEKLHGEVLIPDFLPDDAESRRALFFQIGKSLVKLGGTDEVMVCAGMVMPAWLSFPRNPNEVIQPSLDPNRSEVVIVDAATFDHRSASIVQHVDRDPEGKILLASRDEFFPKDSQPSPQMENTLIESLFKGYNEALMEAMGPQLTEIIHTPPDQAWDYFEQKK